MNKDKRIVYLLPVIIFAFLLAALFIDAGSSKIVAACMLLPFAVLTVLLVKKRTAPSINKREVLLTAVVIAILYVILIQMTGVSFGLYKNPYFVNAEGLYKTVLPLMVIIVATEIIRNVLLVQKNKFAAAASFLICVLAEVLAHSNVAGVTTFNRFMDLIGLTLFPAISANIYYHYVSRSYGALPNIAYRLIISLYVYFLPSTTGMTNSLIACSKIVLPIVALMLVSGMFAKEKKKAVRKGEKFSVLGMILSVAIIAGVAMLISCQFRFGALVIATDSMTGEINKGDMVIYERYEDQSIKEGQVIIFADGPSKIVHRVVRIEKIGEEVRYYTKGDANPTNDIGYRVESDIVGLTDVKISYIGYPTLWLRELVNPAN